MVDYVQGKNKFKALLVERFFKGIVLSSLSDKQYTVLDYFFFKRKFPNLKNPTTFSEKIQWIKVYGSLERFTKYADKYTVRDYVEKTIGRRYLVPLIGVYNKFDDIPFDKLPNKFILKVSNSSGYNFICEDKKKLDKKELKITLNTWMSVNFYYEHREIQYKQAKTRIVIEPLLGDGKKGLSDFKFFCKNGEPQMIEVYTDVHTSPKVDLMDLNWKNLNISLHFPGSGKEVKKPKQFNEMLEISKKLSKNFPFVRVDLYLFKNKVYFGELTFTPGNGMYNIKPIKGEYILGKLIDIHKYN